MINKKQIIIRSIITSLVICMLSTLVAYIWSKDTFLYELVVGFVAIISFISAIIVTGLGQIIFIRKGRKAGYLFSGATLLTLVILGLVGL